MKNHKEKIIHDLYSTNDDFEAIHYDEIGGYPYAKYRMKMVLKILDLGCSTGILLRNWRLNSHAGIGIDFSEVLINQGKEKMNMVGVDSSCLNVGDAKDLSKFKSNSFDAVLALGLHLFMTEREEIKSYKDILRILKPDGLIITSYINELVHYFTLNSYTVSLYSKILNDYDISKDEKEIIIEEFSNLLTNPSIPHRTPTDGVRREHNPLTTPKIMEDNGFAIVDLFFCKFFALPPLLKNRTNFPNFDNYSEKLEIKHARTWLAYFNAHAFCIVGKNKIL